jgi:hypothetical protein
MFTHACRITRGLLLSCQSASCRLDKHVRDLVSQLRPRRHRCRRCRSGEHVRLRKQSVALPASIPTSIRCGEIPTIIGRRIFSTVISGLTMYVNKKHSVLRMLPRSPTSEYTSVGLVNAQSVGNKHAAICDRIASGHLDLCAIVETWYDSADSTQLIACAPLGCRLV